MSLFGLYQRYAVHSNAPDATAATAAIATHCNDCNNCNMHCNTLQHTATQHNRSAIHHLVRLLFLKQQKMISFLKQQKRIHFSKRAQFNICSTPKLPCLAPKEPFEFAHKSLKCLYKSAKRDARQCRDLEHFKTAL